MIVGALLRPHAHQSSHDLGKITGHEARVAGVAGVTAEQALIASRQRTAPAGHPETQDQSGRLASREGGRRHRFPAKNSRWPASSTSNWCLRQIIEAARSESSAG